MTRTEAKKLKEGDRVQWLPDGSFGLIAEKSYAAARINWDDGKAGLFQFADPKCPWNQIEKVEVGEWKRLNHGL